jgi:hypothetical protein
LNIKNSGNKKVERKKGIRYPKISLTQSFKINIEYNLDLKMIKSNQSLNTKKIKIPKHKPFKILRNISRNRSNSFFTSRNLSSIPEEADLITRKNSFGLNPQNLPTIHRSYIPKNRSSKGRLFIKINEVSAVMILLNIKLGDKNIHYNFNI